MNLTRKWESWNDTKTEDATNERNESGEEVNQGWKQRDRQYATEPTSRLWQASRRQLKRIGRTDMRADRRTDEGHQKSLYWPESDGSDDEALAGVSETAQNEGFVRYNVFQILTPTWIE